MFLQRKTTGSLSSLGTERIRNCPKNDTHNIKEDLANVNSVQQVTDMVLKKKA